MQRGGDKGAKGKDASCAPTPKNKFTLSLLENGNMCSEQLSTGDGQLPLQGEGAGGNGNDGHSSIGRWM